MTNPKKKISAEAATSTETNEHLPKDNSRKEFTRMGTQLTPHAHTKNTGNPAIAHLADRMNSTRDEIAFRHGGRAQHDDYVAIHVNRADLSVSKGHIKLCTECARDYNAALKKARQREARLKAQQEAFEARQAHNKMRDALLEEIVGIPKITAEEIPLYLLGAETSGNQALKALLLKAVDAANEFDRNAGVFPALDFTLTEDDLEGANL